MTAGREQRRARPARRGPRTVRSRLVPLAVVIVCAAAAALLLWWAWMRPAGGRPPGPPYQIVRVPAGASFDAVADSLARRGLLRHGILLRLAARLTGQDRRLRAGVYTMPAGLSPRAVLALLAEGKAAPARVVLPEGIEAEEAARRVADGTGCDAGLFLAVADSLARAGLVADGLLGGAERLARLTEVRDATAGRLRWLHWCEGYLAPDTYFLAPGLPAATAARVIVSLGLARADSLAREIAPAMRALGLTPHDVVTLASLVEAEVRLPQERPLVAAVYANRLRRGWRLEADPTVAYALRKRGERISFRDLEVDSPWNTYRQAGLPPGPIGCPGVAALRAAARPDSACDALFFVADGQGGHVFSRSLEAHERAARAWRAGREDGPPPNPARPLDGTRRGE